MALAEESAMTIDELKEAQRQHKRIQFLVILPSAKPIWKDIGHEYRQFKKWDFNRPEERYRVVPW